MTAYQAPRPRRATSPRRRAALALRGSARLLCRRARWPAARALRGPALLAAAAALLAGCGELKAPSDAVMVIDGKPVERAEFEHWLGVTTRWTRPDLVTPDPANDYAACIAAKRKAGSTTKPDALKAECAADYETLRSEALRVLISLRWLGGEAEDLGLKIEDAEVRRALKEQKRLTFLREGDYRAFLQKTRTSEADMLVSARLAVLSKRVYEAAVDRRNRVSDADIRAYYDANRGSFRRPDTRDLKLIRTKTRRDAAAARAALQAGNSWSAVAAARSTDKQSAAAGGRLNGRSRGQLEPVFAEAVFSARAGILSRPVKATDGWYVFEVTAVHPGGPQAFDDARKTIRQLLRSERQHDILSDFTKEFQARWKARTQCAQGFVTVDCANA